MKTNLLSKLKWYAVGILILIDMLTVSISFCSWDNLHLKVGVSGASGDYVGKYKLKYDANKNNIPDVGDTVSFGKYYQSANTTTKSDIVWVVLHSENNQLTLMTEKIMAFGSFWGSYYHNGTEYLWGNTANGYNYQNYSVSTLRSWLNSYYGARNDAGEAFAANAADVKMRGFFNEAFTLEERAYVLPKTIFGVKGYSVDSAAEPLEDYAQVNDKVWALSWTEVFGREQGANIIDGMPNQQYDYFSKAIYPGNNEILIAKPTAFAASVYSNYTLKNATSAQNMQNSNESTAIWWWLRSPAFAPNYARYVTVDGAGYGLPTSYSSGGVRPAIIIPA